MFILRHLDRLDAEVNMSKGNITMSWKSELLKLKKQDAKPPVGGQTLEQISKELGYGEEKTRDVINRLIKSGRAEKIPGKMLTATGSLIQTMYYRLIGESVKSKPKK